MPTTIEFVDIAGLVAGASKGEGLGNQFLANIRETDAVAHVVRCFEDDDVIHVANKIKPLDDIEIINTELALADLQSLEKALTKAQKLAKTGDKTAKLHQNQLELMRNHLNDGQAIRSMGLDKEQMAIISDLHLLTAKPTMYIANVDDAGFDNNPLLEQVKDLAEKEGAQVVAICAAIESELVELDDDERQEFLKDLGQDEPGLNRVIRAGYMLLNLQTYFTAGVKEVRAWTVEIGATAPESAAVIHTDFQKGFIKAEVISYDDFIQYNGEKGSKEAGKWRLEGKDYITQDGDVMHFRFNV
jgi:hypothetical protein